MQISIAIIAGSLGLMAVGVQGQRDLYGKFLQRRSHGALRARASPTPGRDNIVSLPTTTAFTACPVSPGGWSASASEFLFRPFEGDEGVYLFCEWTSAADPEVTSSCVYSAVTGEVLSTDGDAGCAAPGPSGQSDQCFTECRTRSPGKQWVYLDVDTMQNQAACVFLDDSNDELYYCMYDSVTGEATTEQGDGIGDDTAHCQAAGVTISRSTCA